MNQEQHKLVQKVKMSSKNLNVKTENQSTSLIFETK